MYKLLLLLRASSRKQTPVHTTVFLLQDRLWNSALLIQLISKGSHLEVFMPETTQLKLLRFITKPPQTISDWFRKAAQSTAIFPQPKRGPETCQNTKAGINQ